MNYRGTSRYINDTFGLRTIMEASKCHFRTTPRGHMSIHNSEMKVLLDDYVIPPAYRKPDWSPVPPAYVAGDEPSGLDLNYDARYPKEEPASQVQKEAPLSEVQKEEHLSVQREEPPLAQKEEAAELYI